jgi:ABC-type uncharacterized transport system permease subunit
MQMVLHVFVAIAYLTTAVVLWRRSARVLSPMGASAPVGPVVGTPRGGVQGLLVVAWIAHAWSLYGDALVDGNWRFGFAIALSATLWIVLLILWFETRVVPLASLWLAVLPLAALCVLVALAFPGSVVLGQLSGADVNGARSPWLPVHLVVALAAYGLLTIAAVHALFMAALDRWLHRDRGRAWLAPEVANDDRPEGVESRMLGALPPLLTMERVLFRLIGAGFVLLTLTVLTGVVFSEALFGQPMRFDHKTVFTLIAWATFGALLAGRATRGWRGSVALSWTLGGFAMLFLAYAGSRFVLEVILHKV